MSSSIASAITYLVPPDTIVERPGEGAAVALGSLAGKALLLALRIEEIIEQESLHVAVWGSADGTDWGTNPLFWFPERFYCGATPTALDLGQRPEINFLRARWQVNRWGRGYPMPRFKFSLEIQILGGD